jgi:hypothetical protein
MTGWWRTRSAAWLAALACAAGVAAAAAGASRASQDTPVDTVRDFLGSAVVNDDGFSACRYLTPRARVSFEAPGTGQTCESWFARAELTLGGLQVQSDAQLRLLTYRVLERGADRLVQVSHRGQSVSFLLRPADHTDATEFLAPATDWRIDSSVAALAPAVTTSSRV